MNFIIQEPQNQDVYLIYEREGYSFDTLPHSGFSFTALMINDLSLEIDDEGRIIYVWGYCPLIVYELTNEVPEEYSAHSLVALLKEPPIPGVSIRINKERWPVYINKEKGWVCLGNPQTKGKRLIEFAPSCVAAMEGQEIVAVWLHPRELPELS